MASKSENDRLIDEILKQKARVSGGEETSGAVRPKTEQPEVSQPVRNTDAPQEPYRPKHAYEPEETEQAPVRIAPARTAEPQELDVPLAEKKQKRSKPQQEAPQKKKKKRRKHKSARIYNVLIMLTLIFVISISLAVGIIQVGKDMLGLNGTETLMEFNIPEGATTADIAKDLHAAGIIEFPRAFVFFSKLSDADADYIAGDHEVSSAMAYETLISELTGAAIEQQVSVDVMFPEGITLIEAAEKLEDAGVCDSQKFLYYFNAGGYGYTFEDYLPQTLSKLKFYKMEGYLFPDTYTFYEDMDPEDVCRKIYMNFNSKITDEDYARMEELGLTLDETITFASMVQAEAANEGEMKDIASVFWNRLDNADTYPLLQSDPTSKYVEETIKPNIELPDELIYNAYDTYVCSGLPAGAIGNPGQAAIEAVLYPNETPYFYFYANVDTGVTYFAETLEEHNQNIEMVAQQQQEAAQAGENAE
jgi:UPF0755 protein